MPEQLRIYEETYRGVKIIAEEYERRWEAWAQGYAARTRRHATREDAVSELIRYFDEYADRF
jgi:hypothetical protein